MYHVLGCAAAALGASASVAAVLHRRRLVAHRREGRVPDHAAERRSVRYLLAGITLLSAGVVAILLAGIAA